MLPPAFCLRQTFFDRKENAFSPSRFHAYPDGIPVRDRREEHATTPIVPTPLAEPATCIPAAASRVPAPKTHESVRPVREREKQCPEPYASPGPAGYRNPPPLPLPSLEEFRDILSLGFSASQPRGMEKKGTCTGPSRRFSRPRRRVRTGAGAQAGDAPPVAAQTPIGDGAGQAGRWPFATSIEGTPQLFPEEGGKVDGFTWPALLTRTQERVQR